MPSARRTAWPSNNAVKLFALMMPDKMTSVILGEIDRAARRQIFERANFEVRGRIIAPSMLLRCERSPSCEVRAGHFQR
jgi:hypothetical protein